MATTIALIGNVLNHAAGPSTTIGTSTGCCPWLSAIRASSTLIATRSTVISVRPPACPTANTSDGDNASIAALSTARDSPKTHGSWRAITRHPPIIALSRLETTSQEGLTDSPPKGSNPVMSTVFILPPYRNIRKYIRNTLTSSSSMPVGTCALITAFLSGSSSNAAGTILKFAAIGVISVPQ